MVIERESLEKNKDNGILISTCDKGIELVIEI